MTYDPENMNRMSSSQRANRFVPIEEVPDNDPNPSESMMIKEEASKEKEAENIPKNNGHIDVNDLSRPASYLYMDDADDQREGVIDKRVLLSEPDQAGDGEKIESELSKKDKSGPLGAEDRPMKVAKDGKFHVIDSHGRRGRKPLYKDKIT
jgi:hypothetical protein